MALPEIRIISIKQPWATLIVRGLKDIENRDWRTFYRGPVLVQASQKADAIDLAEIESGFGVKLPSDLEFPRGGVVGVTRIVDCVERHRSRWFVGDFGFVLEDSRPLPFVPCLGALSIRRAPPEVLMAYAAELRAFTARDAIAPAGS